MRDLQQERIKKKDITLYFKKTVNKTIKLNGNEL